MKPRGRLVYSEEELGWILEHASKCDSGGYIAEADDTTNPHSEVFRIVTYDAIRRRKEQGTTARTPYIATVYSVDYARYCVSTRPDTVRALVEEVLAQRKEIEGLRKERLNIQDLRKHIRELRGLLDDAKKKIRDLGGEP